MTLLPSATQRGGKISEPVLALLLQRRVYERIAADPAATPRAAAVVLFVAAVHGASALVRARAFGWDPFAASLFGFLGELTFWAGAGLSAAALSRRGFGVSTPLGAYYRTLGLASAPGVLIAAAAAASVVAPGTERAVLPLVALYRVAALFLAVWSTAGLSRAQAVITSFAALGGGLTAVAAVTVPLSAALPG